MSNIEKTVNSNLLTVAIIAGFAILLGFFAWQFGTQTEKSANNIAQTSKETSASINATVNKAVRNVTNAFTALVDLKENEVSLLRNLSLILMEERETNRENLRLFLDTFANQSESEVNATLHLEEAVVKALAKSQNLTEYSQNLTEKEMQLDQEANDKLEELIVSFVGNNTTNNTTPS